MFHKFTRLLKKFTNFKRNIDNSSLLFLQISLYNFLNKTKYKALPIGKISDLKPITFLESGYSYVSYAQNNTVVKVANLKLYFAGNAIVNSLSSAIIINNIVYYQSISENERFNEGFIKYHSKKKAVVDFSQTEEISEGFFLSGNGSFNWYHWIIEILPKILYFPADKTATILVDRSCQKIPSMHESLLYFLDNLPINIIYLDPGKNYRVKNLFFLNEINKLMFNALDPDNREFPLFYYRKNVLQRLREVFTKKSVQDDPQGQKIYLCRKQSHRNAKNEKQLDQMLTSKGFSTIDLCSMKFNEQIKVFATARVIVGITGAAWTNILFCQPGTELLILMPSNFKEYKFYSEMAEMLDLRLTYYYYENGSDNHTSNNFSINIEKLKKIV